MEEHDLLRRFNDKDTAAFGDVYLKFYDEFYHLAHRLFCDTELSPEDVVQDIFVNLLEKQRINFDSIQGIKLYIYVCIRNRQRNHFSHTKHKSLFRSDQLCQNTYTAYIAETEIYSAVSKAIGLLPEECAKVFRLHLEGYDVRDISVLLGKSESTIYKQKQESIKILKEKIREGKILAILMF